MARIIPSQTGASAIRANHCAGNEGPEDFGRVVLPSIAGHRAGHAESEIVPAQQREEPSKQKGTVRRKVGSRVGEEKHQVRPKDIKAKQRDGADAPFPSPKLSAMEDQQVQADRQHHGHGGEMNHGQEDAAQNCQAKRRGGGFVEEGRIGRDKDGGDGNAPTAVPQ